MSAAGLRCPSGWFLSWSTGSRACGLQLLWHVGSVDAAPEGSVTSRSGGAVYEAEGSQGEVEGCLQRLSGVGDGAQSGPEASVMPGMGLGA